MRDPYADDWERMARAILTTPGALAPDVRAALERAGAREAGDVPPELERLLPKILHGAYAITDEDVEALRTSMSEDAVFEATLAAALGAARVHLQAGLRALREARA